MYYRLLLEHEEEGIVWDQILNELLIPDLKRLIENIFNTRHMRYNYCTIDNIEINEPFTIVSFTIDSNDEYKLHINELSLVCHECGEPSDVFCKSCGQPICSSHDYNGECEACVHSIDEDFYQCFKGSPIEKLMIFHPTLTLQEVMELND